MTEDELLVALDQLEAESENLKLRLPLAEAVEISSSANLVAQNRMLKILRANMASLFQADVVSIKEFSSARATFEKTQKKLRAATEERDKAVLIFKKTIEELRELQIEIEALKGSLAKHKPKTNVLEFKR